MKNRNVWILGSVGFFILSGCSIKPNAIGDRTQLENTYQTVETIFQKQDQVSGSVAISEAVARTLKYNLGNRVRQAQSLLENGNLELAKLEMLPEMNMEANHSFRNNEQVQNLIQDGQIVEGQQSYTPKKINTYSAEIRWNILDFGLSYARAQQQANRVLAVQEQKRKLTQELLQEATSAYWKAWTAQEIMGEVVAYKKKVIEALNRSRSLSSSDVGDIQAELDYQQVLIRSLRRVNQLQMQISDARVQLMELMNVNPKSDFNLVEPTQEMTRLPELAVDIQKMDVLALVYRPELREASYEKLIQEKGVRIAMLNMLPGLTFDFGYNHTDNQFMKNKSWMGGNYNATWSLLRSITRGPYEMKVARQSVEFQKLKQAATTMAVLTQVRMANYGYLLAREDYEYADEDAKVTDELFQFAIKLEKAQQGNEQITIRRGIEKLESHFDRQVAFAKAQEALARLYQSVGIDVLVEQDRDLPLMDLSRKVEEVLLAQSHGDFNTLVDERYTKLMPLVDPERSFAGGLSVNDLDLSSQPKLEKLTSEQLQALGAKEVVTVPLVVPAQPMISDESHDESAEIISVLEMSSHVPESPVVQQVHSVKARAATPEGSPE